MFTRSVRRIVGFSATGLAAAAAFPAIGQAALINIGSNLSAPATVAIAHPVDTAFWSTAVTGGAKVRAPRAGQVLAVRLRGCAKRGAGGQTPTTQIHFQVLAPGAGSAATIGVTSGPSNLPICGGSASGSTVSTFRPVNLCVASGDYVAFNDEGGFGAGFATGVAYELFARAPGATTESFTGGGATNNGDHLSGSAHAGVELLMQVVLGTGHNAGPACGG
jgi:hypothetical protein